MAGLVLVLALLLLGILWFAFRHRPGRRGARRAGAGRTHDLASLLATEDEPEARRRLERALLQADLVVPARPRPGAAAEGPGRPSPAPPTDGETAEPTVLDPGVEGPAGGLELGHVRLGGRLHVPVFSREEHLGRAMEAGSGSVVLDGRTLFPLVPRETPVVVDPGFPTERRLAPETVARLGRLAAAGASSPELERLREEDAALAGALEAHLAENPRVRRAHLARVSDDEGDSRLVLGLEVDGDLRPLVQQLVEKVQASLPTHGAVDFCTLEPGPLTDLLLGTEPLVDRRKD